MAIDLTPTPSQAEILDPAHAKFKMCIRHSAVSLVAVLLGLF